MKKSIIILISYLLLLMFAFVVFARAAKKNYDMRSDSADGFQTIELPADVHHIVMRGAPDNYITVQCMESTSGVTLEGIIGASNVEHYATNDTLYISILAVNHYRTLQLHLPQHVRSIASENIELHIKTNALHPQETTKITIRTVDQLHSNLFVLLNPEACGPIQLDLQNCLATFRPEYSNYEAPALDIVSRNSSMSFDGSFTHYPSKISITADPQSSISARFIVYQNIEHHALQTTVDQE